tara:strand:- start:263 stop:1015 length:753 start_codon:yes stop_codon:yes gene_type:complete
MEEISFYNINAVNPYLTYPVIFVNLKLKFSYILMRTYDIFPTYVSAFDFPLTHHEKLKDRCMSIITQAENSKTNEKNGISNPLLMHYYDPRDGLNLLDCEGFDVFHNWIKACSKEYINKTLRCKCEDVIISECWLNVCDSGGSQSSHNHCNSIVSGTYFVNFVPGKHAPLSFKNKRVANKPFLQLNCPDEQTEGWFNDVKTSTLLLWESHIKHGYKHNKENNRITISFNVIPSTITNGTYGFKLSRLGNS